MMQWTDGCLLLVSSGDLAQLVGRDVHMLDKWPLKQLAGWARTLARLHAGGDGKRTEWSRGGGGLSSQDGTAANQ